MAERLDEERLEILRAWGAGLSTSDRDELRAAGKAIVMLIEEIDRLQIDLWHARAERPELVVTPAPIPELVRDLEPTATPPQASTQGSALRERLARTPEPRVV